MIFSGRFVANLLPSVSVKEFRKSVSILMHYEVQNLGCFSFFLDLHDHHHHHPHHRRSTSTPRLSSFQPSTTSSSTDQQLGGGIILQDTSWTNKDCTVHDPWMCTRRHLDVPRLYCPRTYTGRRNSGQSLDGQGLYCLWTGLHYLWMCTYRTVSGRTMTRTVLSTVIIIQDRGRQDRVWTDKDCTVHVRTQDRG